MGRLFFQRKVIIDLAELSTKQHPLPLTLRSFTTTPLPTSQILLLLAKVSLDNQKLEESGRERGAGNKPYTAVH